MFWRKTNMTKQQSAPPTQQPPKIEPIVAFEANGKIYNSRMEAAKAHVNAELDALLPKRDFSASHIYCLWADDIIQHKARIMELLTWLDKQERE